MHQDVPPKVLFSVVTVSYFSCCWDGLWQREQRKSKSEFFSELKARKQQYILHGETDGFWCLGLFFCIYADKV